MEAKLRLLSLEACILFAHHMEQCLLTFQDLDESTFSFLNCFVIICPRDILFLQGCLDLLEAFIQHANLLLDLALFLFFLGNHLLDVFLITLDTLNNFDQFGIRVAQ